MVNNTDLGEQEAIKFLGMGIISIPVAWLCGSALLFVLGKRGGEKKGDLTCIEHT
jgi:hypothetical protein